jgi:hypothetical protein
MIPLLYVRLHFAIICSLHTNKQGGDYALRRKRNAFAKRDEWHDEEAQSLRRGYERNSEVKRAKALDCITRGHNI